MKILGLGTGLGALFAALLGAMSITAEFRTGTIRATLLGVGAGAALRGQVATVVGRWSAFSGRPDDPRRA